MNLLSLPSITAALPATPGPVTKFNAPPKNLVIQANFVGASGGTSVDAYVQTSVDGGQTWTDIANFHFLTTPARKLFNLNGRTPVTTQATPTDGSLAANTAVDGLLGPQYRVKYTSVGVYSATSLSIDIACDQAVGT